MAPINPSVKTACAVALLVVLGSALALAQTATTTTSVEPTSGAPQEGIKVHGDWTITVRNLDGTVTARHEFKNALSNASGGPLLSQLLGGTAVSGTWMVWLFPSPTNACEPGNGPCRIAESSAPYPAHSKDLTRTVPTSGPDAGRLVLQGSVRIPVAATIGSVTTTVAVCAPTVISASCVSATTTDVTQRTLSSGIAVAPNQLVEVKVVISFS